MAQCLLVDLRLLEVMYSRYIRMSWCMRMLSLSHMQASMS